VSLHYRSKNNLLDFSLKLDPFAYLQITVISGLNGIYHIFWSTFATFFVDLCNFSLWPVVVVI
jgi:hypothetical protein